MASIEESVEYTYSADTKNFVVNVGKTEKAANKSSKATEAMGKTSEKVFGKMGIEIPSASVQIVGAITAIATASYAVVEAMYAMQNAVEVAIAGVYSAILAGAGVITTALDDVASSIIGLGIDPARIEQNANAIISLGIAADAAGASVEGLAKANVAYYKTILASEEPTEKMTQAVNTLGISAYNADGSIKSLSQIIVELERVVIESGYSATIVAAIYQIFGASASNLFNIIAFGTENFKQLAQKIADTITPEVIAELQTFHQQVSILTVKAQVAVILFASWAATMAETWIPKIQAAIQTMRDAIARTKEWWNESSVLVPILEALWQIMVLLHDIISPVINLIQEVIRWFDDWWDETSKINKVLQKMYDIISSITGAIDNLIDKVFDLINAFQDFRAENFGSDLVNLGASSANAANQQAMFSTIPNFIGGQGNVTNSTTNTFNISPRQTMSYRDAYRQGQLATARGGL